MTATATRDDPLTLERMDRCDACGTARAVVRFGLATGMLDFCFACTKRHAAALLPVTLDLGCGPAAAELGLTTAFLRDLVGVQR